MRRAMIERILLLAGPPFGAALFAGVEARLRQKAPGMEVSAAAVPWGDQPPFLPDVSGALVVAHGLAVPAAVAGSEAAAALVVSNGPVTRLDPFAAALSGAAHTTLAATALRGVLASPLWTAWLRSSVGLRRVVSNPYSMDRDTVAALCGPPVADGPSRARLLTYLRWLGEAVPVPVPACPATVVWGDADSLYPASEADAFDILSGNPQRVSVAGGHFVHPEESPWALADAILAIARGGRVPAADPGTTTATSRSGRSSSRSGERGRASVEE